MCRTTEEKKEGGTSPALELVTSLHISVNIWKPTSEWHLVWKWGREAREQPCSLVVHLAWVCIHPSPKNTPSNLRLSPAMNCYEHPTSNNELFLLPKWPLVIAPMLSLWSKTHKWTRLKMEVAVSKNICPSTNLWPILYRLHFEF